MVSLYELLSKILERVPGDVVEVGVGNGQSALGLAAVITGDRAFYAYDTFNGFPLETLIDGEDKALAQDIGHPANTDVEKTLKDCGIVCIKGVFPNTFWVKKPSEVCFVHLDGDTYIATKAGLDLFWPIASKGALFCIHDYDNLNLSGVRRAVDEWRKEQQDGFEEFPTDTHWVIIKR